MHEHARVDAIFLEACALPGDERTAFLERACGDDLDLRREVDELLAHDERTNPRLDALDAGGGAARLALDLEDAGGLGDDDGGALPERIGPYRILRVLGQGGMGTVFEAEQDDPRRSVALKVIRAGWLDATNKRRFRHEAHVLGLLRHPGIAQIYEAGTLDDHGGQPYFVMELIEGEPLSTFARGRGLNVRDRLQLLAEVCDAVQHAHQRGVIHRDLKPGNILVDMHGQPKILDFGVARVTDADIRTTTIGTGVGQLIGTLPYMSPEQASGDPDELDTRSDVYALGVLAYELLVERLPYDVDYKRVHDAVRAIQEDRPAPISSINRRLKGDVETILGKALEKDKTRRYQTASALAGDIRRYLANEPITAQPPTMIYQLRTFARRHRALVTATTAVMCMLVGTLIVVTLALTQAVDARNLAEFEAGRAQDKATTAEEVSNFLVELFEIADPHATPGQTVTVDAVVERGAERIRTELVDQPQVRASLMLTLGQVFENLGQFQRAAEITEEAIALREQTLGPNDPEVATATDRLTSILYELGDYPRTLELSEKSLAICRANPDTPGDRLGLSLNNLGWINYELGNSERAETLLREAVATRLAFHDGDDMHADVAESLNNLAVVFTARQQFDEARTHYERALAIRKAVLHPNHPDVAFTLQNLAILAEAVRDLPLSERYFREAFEIAEAAFEDDNPGFATLCTNFGRVLHRMGKLADAEVMCRRAVDIDRASRGDDHPYVAYDLVQLGRVLTTQRKLDDAVEAHREALAIYERQEPTDHGGIAMAAAGVGQTLARQERWAEAEPYMRKAIEGWSERVGPDDRRTAICESTLARILIDLDRPLDAEPLALHSYEVLYADLTSDIPRVSPRQISQVLRAIVSVYKQTGDTEALATWQPRLEAFDQEYEVASAE